MARPPRIQLADALYHVYARGNERAAIYRDDGDRRSFLKILAAVVEDRHWRILAYCLMPNHYHLVLQTPEPNLALGMRQLNGVYAQSFNRRHARVGHLFQGRYGARIVQRDAYVLTTVRYVVRNPVRAGLCALPHEWRWSSHRATLGTVPSSFLDRNLLLSFFGSTRAQALDQYEAHCDEADPSLPALHPLAAGDDDFVADVVGRVAVTPALPRRFLQRPRPALARLLGAPGGGGIVSAREHGYGVREIARHLGVAPSTVSRRLHAARGDATVGT